jgi:hypothetical protein
MSTKLTWIVLAAAACRAAPPRATSGSATAGSATAGSATAGSATAGSATAGSETASSATTGAPSDPWAGRDAGPAVPDTPERRAARAKAALDRVASIMPKLAALRELAFLHDIPREYQSNDDFRGYVHREIARELPPDKAADQSDALFRLGLLAQPANLAQLEEQAFVTQAGAYYDPKQKKFFLVTVPDNDLMLDTMSAHELTHGLQDQHFDLDKYLPDEGDALDDDAATARRFVVEGDATFTMFLYMAAQMSPGGKVPAGVTDALVAQLHTLAALSPAELAKQSSPMASSNDPEIQKSLDAMADIPPTVLVPMIDSYMQGALLVAEAHKRGGWQAVNDLFAHPPQSTEQALHPAKLFAGERPHRVVLPKLRGKELLNVVLGELQWQVYFSLWAPDQKVKASEGWGGDRESVVRKPDGRFVARVATIWDTPADASEFAAAYAASLAKRFPKGSGDPASAAGFDRGDGAGKVFVKVVGPEVFAVDGADDPKELAALAAGAHVD